MTQQQDESAQPAPAEDGRRNRWKRLLLLVPQFANQFAGLVRRLPRQFGELRLRALAAEGLSKMWKRMLLLTPQLTALVTRISRQLSESLRPLLAPGERGQRWKRMALLVPLFVALFFVAVAERGHPANGKSRKDGIVATLLDPLSLFAGRSPGEREGALLPVKLAKAGPEERVLSTIRDRDPAGDPGAGAAPPADGLLPDAGLPGAPGTERALPGGGGPAGGDGFTPFGGAPFSNFGGPESGFIPGGFGRPGGGVPPPGDGVPPPGGVAPPGIPITSAVPEPGTWIVMILGFFAVGWTMRRRMHLRPDLLSGRAQQ